MLPRFLIASEVCVSFTHPLLFSGEAGKRWRIKGKMTGAYPSGISLKSEYGREIFIMTHTIGSIEITQEAQDGETHTGAQATH
jgi:hypothetical protein